MSIVKFEIFLKTVELGSLTRAAETLGLTQSGVSHGISSLETEYGFLLLNRNKTGVTLTENGKRVLRHVRDILNQYEQLKQEVAAINGLEAGTIRIGTFTSVSIHWLPGIIKRFRLDHPQIVIRLKEGDYGDIEAWLKNGEIDLGFTSLSASSFLETIPLQRDRMLCILPKDHPLSRQPVINYAQLENESFILPSYKCGYDVRKVLEKASIDVEVQFEAGDDRAIIAMVENGLGISIMSELALTGQHHNISVVELEDGANRLLGISVNSLKQASPASKTFIESSRGWLAGV